MEDNLKVLLPPLGFMLCLMAPLAQAVGPVYRPIDVQYYRLHLTVDPTADPKTYDATLDTGVKALSRIRSITLDQEGLTIQHVSLQPAGTALSFSQKPGQLTIKLPHALAKGGTVELSLAYQGPVRISQAGFFKLHDPDEPDRGEMLFTDFEPQAARLFYPCHDTPDDKAVTETFVTVPSQYTVESNGRLVSDRALTHDGKPWHEVHWAMSHPQSTYLLAIAIAPFTKLEKTVDGKELSIYVGKTKAASAQFSLDSTARSFTYFEKYLDVPYPWDKYAQIGIPTYLNGGMENTTSTFMNQERLMLNDPGSEFEKVKITGLVAHELAHQWFGDYVTMKWWDDLWLNESFANFMDWRATREAFPPEEADIQAALNVWGDYFLQENGPRSHPIVDEDLASPDDAFDSISYDKGENVLRMLMHYVGEDKFQAGVHAYLLSHSYANATNKELFNAIEKSSGEKLEAFRRSWLYERGYPVVQYHGQWDDKAHRYTLTVIQSPNHSGDKTVFHFRLPVVFHRQASPSFTKPILLQVDTSSVTQTVELDAEPDWITVNPGQEVLARVEPPAGSEKSLTLQLANDPSPLARVWAGYALMGNLLDGGALPPDSEAALNRALDEESSPYVRVAWLRGFQRMKSRWLPEKLGAHIVELVKAGQAKAFDSDPHGWKQWHSELLGTLGRVNNPEAIRLLSHELEEANLPLDDLEKASLAVARIGNIDVLKDALNRHGGQGYRYRYLVLYAFGALESPLAAGEIRKISRTEGEDLMGKLPLVIRENGTLKNSAQWADFLKQFLIADHRFGDEVKARLLQTVEDVKTPEVKNMLQAVVRKCPSGRLKDAARKALSANF